MARAKSFLDNEVAATCALLGATVLALILANSSWHGGVEALFDAKLGYAIGDYGIKKPVRLWINDGLMALFFLLVGLEIKREVVEGELSKPSQIVLPVAGAVGGMAVPAAFYVALNWHDATALRGWAIPSATDIAFSLGVLAALGNRVPPALRLFLATLAIVDDLGAIAIIAVFYTGNLSALALAVAALCLVGLAMLNSRGAQRLWPYALIGLVLWAAVLKSGVHATLAGVALALFIPIRPAVWLEHVLKPWTLWLIMPVFAFANAGLPLSGLSPAVLDEHVTIGIVAGLFAGKQIGIMLGAGLPIWLGRARLPAGATWLSLYGVSILAGIGFTMSLFIGTLAFADERHETEVRLGVLAGSLLSAIVGWLVLRFATRRP